MSDPWRYIYDQTGYDPLDQFARKERETRMAAAGSGEYCEIHWKEAGFLGGKSYFYAEAVGPQGVYEAARSSRTFGGPPTFATDKKAKAALDELIATLSAKGWEPIGRGREWFEYAFRLPKK